MGNTYEPAWVLDIVHATAGTVRASTRDLYGTADIALLGGFYPQYITQDITVVRELQDFGSGIDLPEVTTVQIANVGAGTAAKLISPAYDWRNAKARLRRYDRTSGSVSTRFEGVIKSVRYQAGRASILLGSQDEATLDTILPRIKVNAAEFPSATDLGSPIPVILGPDAVVRPPYVGTNAGTAGNINEVIGSDFVVGGTSCTVGTVYWDSDRLTPGLEVGVSWTLAQGNPTYVSSTKFSVTGDKTYHYDVGRPLRFNSTEHTYVASYESGTITVSDAVVPNPIGTAESAAEFVIEKSRYSAAGPGGGTYALTNVRGLTGAMASSLLVTAGCPTFGNPGSAIKEILTNAAWGLGETVSDTAFDAAVTAFDGVGLGTAVRGGIGLDRNFRRARDVLDDLLSMRGARLRRDYTTGSWAITVDSQPAGTALTLGLGTAAIVNNLTNLESRQTTSADRAIKTLFLRYASGGRARDKLASFTPADYQYEIEKEVLGTVGVNKTVLNPFLRDHASAKRVLDYQAKVAQYGDEEIVLTAPAILAGTVSVGDLVRLDVPDEGIALATYRTYRTSETAAQMQLTLRGYSAAIYTDTSAGIDSPSDASIDETNLLPGTGFNLLDNPDFSTQLTEDRTPDSTDTTLLPGWWVQSADGVVSSISITESAQALGGHYLQVVVTGTPSIDPVLLLQGLAASNNANKGVAVSEEATYVVSIYCNRQDGWRWRAFWVSSGSTVRSASNPALRFVNNSDSNGLGWFRGYSVLRAPTHASTVSYCYPIITFTDAGTFLFDAAQFERVTRETRRPTSFNRNNRTGLDPARMQPGALNVRAPGEKEHGTTITHAVGPDIALTGAGTVAVGTIPIRAVLLGVTSRVQNTIALSGASTWSVGTDLNPDAWGSVDRTATGSTTDAFDFTVGGPTSYPNGGTVKLFTAGTFTGGTVRATIHYYLLRPPTA